MSVQGIRIDPETRQIRVSTNGIEKVLPEAQHLDFMKRDGFDTEAEFWEWFNTYFEGVLIHWTPLVY